MRGKSTEYGNSDGDIGTNDGDPLKSTNGFGVRTGMRDTGVRREGEVVDHGSTSGISVGESKRLESFGNLDREGERDVA